MRNSIYLIVFLLLISCRSGLYTVEEIDLSDHKITKKYKMEDFDIYTYCICEARKDEVNNDRFSICPDNFYELPIEDKIVKVEEVYLLKHKSKDLVLYLTTFSHKYIQQGRGFLNNRSVYENKLVLNQIEYVYIGQLNSTEGKIHFPGTNKRQDFTLYFNKERYPKEIALEAANMATSENGYSIAEKFDLSNVFKQDVTYKRREDFKVQFYESFSKIGEIEARDVNCINILSNKGKIEVVYGCEGDDSFYKMTSKRIRYRPDFSLIPR